MKKFSLAFTLIFLFSSCAPATTVVSPTKSSTTTIIPTSTDTPTPQPTSTPTPTPTPALPVSQLTPVPSSNTKITAENVKDLREISRYYGEFDYFAKVTKDNKFLFILDPNGVTKYDYSSMDELANISLANTTSDLQISDDGNWILVDNHWLLDLKNEKEPQVYVLSDFLDFDPQNSVLAPDGSMVAAQRISCPNLCNHKLQIISTKDFSSLYTSSRQTYQSLPAFSSDGAYFAVADMVIQENPDGSTNPAGASVSVLTTNDFTRVSSFSVKFPFYVTDVAFSEDSNLLAIAQKTSIDIYDVLSGSSKVEITELCDSYGREVLFAPISAERLLENSDCSSRIWTISGNKAIPYNNNAPSFSKIAFDDKGNFKPIPYPAPIISDLKAYREEFYFRFLNNDIISFKRFDSATLNKRACDLLLTNSSFVCKASETGFGDGGHLEQEIILATDGKYYAYIVGNNKVDIFSIENPSRVYYSIPFRHYGFSLEALDPINGVVFYNIALSTSINRVIIQDMKTNRILAKWEGRTFLSSITLSENKRYAALCRTIEYNNRLNKDKLIILDLAEKKIVYNETFSCSSVSMVFTSDGSKLALEYYYLQNPKDTKYSTRVVIFNTLPPHDKKYIELDSSSHAIAFSRDDSLLAVACAESDICFFDVTTNDKIFQFKSHSQITNFAFSEDGSLLATSSRWSLISLWAVPPFVNKPNRTQSSPLSSYDPDFIFSWDFNQDGNLEGWEPWNQLEPLRTRNGSLITRSTGDDPFMVSPRIYVNASDLFHIEIRMKVSGGNTASIYFITPSDWYDESKVLHFPIIGDGQFHTYFLDMSKVKKWSGHIRQIRLDPTVTPAAIEIDYIRILP